MTRRRPGALPTNGTVDSRRDRWASREGIRHRRPSLGCTTSSTSSARPKPISGPFPDQLRPVAGSPREGLQPAGRRSGADDQLPRQARHPDGQRHHAVRGGLPEPATNRPAGDRLSAGPDGGRHPGLLAATDHRPGLTGPDKGEGGKYLVLAPGQEAPRDVSGYRVVQSPTNNIIHAFRVLAPDPRRPRP